MSQQLPDAANELLKTPLTVQQRIELIGELWDGIPDSIDALPVPDWHREELDRRLSPPTLIRTPQYLGTK